MAKYDNAYIERLNHRLGEMETRLKIATEYVCNYKALGHYDPDPGVLRLILGIPVTVEDKEPEVPVEKL